MFSLASSPQANAVALKAGEDEDSTFNYKEWACSVGGPEPWEDNASPLTSRINTGVTFFRSTVGGVAMARCWIKSLVVRNQTHLLLLTTRTLVRLHFGIPHTDVIIVNTLTLSFAVLRRRQSGAWCSSHQPANFLGVSDK